MPRIHASAVLLSLWAGLAPAWGAGEIVTDRPDVSESSEVVGAGRFQVETSVAFVRQDQGAAGQHRRTTPTLLRLGVAKDWELRLESDGLVRQTVDGMPGHTSGAADASLGIKWHAQDGDEDDSIPSIAWLLHADLPTGAVPFKGQGVRPSLRMVAEWEWPQGWSVGVMPGLFSARDDAGDHYIGGILAVTLGKEFSPHWRGYVEWAAEQVAGGRHGGNDISADAGVVWLLTPDLQLDASCARGLTRQAPRSVWALGLSIRF
jgi:hypothetical protein